MVWHRLAPAAAMHYQGREVVAAPADPQRAGYARPVPSAGHATTSAESKIQRYVTIEEPVTID